MTDYPLNSAVEKIASAIQAIARELKEYNRIKAEHYHVSPRDED